MIFDYIIIALIVIAFISGMTIAYINGKIDGKRECLLIIRMKFPETYKMLMKEISKNLNVSKRD